MENFHFERCKDIEGLCEITPKVFGDSRGYFFESYECQQFENAGFNMVFVQDNQSFSHKGVIRGLHYQKVHSQGKLVRVVSGKVFDVAVDIRPGSKTYGKWHGVILDSEKKNMFYISEGFAHGFLVLSDTAEFVYKCTNYYYPEEEEGYMWNDPLLAINWPITKEMKLDISDKDKKYKPFQAMNKTSLEEFK